MPATEFEIYNETAGVKTWVKILSAVLALGAAFWAGTAIQGHIDANNDRQAVHDAVQQQFWTDYRVIQGVLHDLDAARADEMQANGLEDECKQMLQKTVIQ